jgi:hypothetical protein
MVQPDQDVVRGVLQTVVRLVQQACRFRGEAAKLITVLDVYQSAKNQMGAHKLWVLQFVTSRGVYLSARST